MFEAIKQPLEVVIAILRNSANEILVAQRAAHKHQGGLWEFPGGKVEPNETFEAALYREIYEELGVTILQAKPFMQYIHAYPDREISLHVWWVESFSGEVCGKEGQAIQWLSLPQLTQTPFPDANQIILKQLFKELS